MPPEESSSVRSSLYNNSLSDLVSADWNCDDFLFLMEEDDIDDIDVKKKKKKKKSVRFSSETPIVHPAETDYPEDPSIVWYKKDDFERLKEAGNVLLRQLKAGEIAVGDESVRGLEARTKVGLGRRQRFKEQSRDAVLEEQHRCQKRQEKVCKSVELIAEAYAATVKQAVQDAYDFGAEDARVVASDYAKIRRKLEAQQQPKKPSLLEKMLKKNHSPNNSSPTKSSKRFLRSSSSSVVSSSTTTSRPTATPKTASGLSSSGPSSTNRFKGLIKSIKRMPIVDLTETTAVEAR